MLELPFLKTAFNQDLFEEFLNNKFNFSKYLQPLANDDDSIDKLEKIGEITTTSSAKNLIQKKIGVFVLQIKPNTKLSRNRVGLRNIVLKQIKQTTSDGALAVYIDGKTEQWRLSFMTIATKFEDNELTKEETASKRYTYLLGKGTQTRTADNRLKQISKTSTFPDITNAFAVEPLTKEFYQKLYKWYEAAQKKVIFPNDDKTKNHINIALIRLITRLLFIWFLKEKELVNIDLFDDTKLKNIIDWDADSSYYKAILQNLFFATLNRPIEERCFREVTNGTPNGSNYLVGNIYRYHMYFKETNKTNIINLFNKTPFLNGGLFECLDRDAIEEETSEFDSNSAIRKKRSAIRVDGFSDRSDNELKIPNDLFFNEETGLINLLKQYQFTAEESTPNDVDVALDPELLGKVFENLLASYNPETNQQARKSTGSFYTPREIVGYMIDESLKAYLQQQLGHEGEQIVKKLFTCVEKHEQVFDATYDETDKLIEAIDTIKILDPAVGSGAFAMGMLQKITSLLAILDPNNDKYKQKQLDKVAEISDNNSRDQAEQAIEKVFHRDHNNYGRKLYIIENCIYGVDIQVIAITIAKLRFFISLAVEQTPNDNANDNYGITSLPNLETKLIATNSLIGLSLPKPNRKKIIERELEPLQNELAKVRRAYFSAKTYKEKKDHKEEDIKTRELLQKTFESYGFDIESAKQISSWSPYDQNAHANWFDPEWMFGVCDGFDIVVGNPPYIKENTNKSVFSPLKKNQYYRGKMDIWYMFACQGIDFLKNNGHLCFIAQNNWVTSFGAKTMRNKVLKDCQISQLLDFGDYKIFENAGIQTMIMLFQKNPQITNYKLDYRLLRCKKETTHKDLLKMLKKQSNKFVKYLDIEMNNEIYIDKFITFSEHDDLLQKLVKRSNLKLDSKDEVAQGLIYPQDFLSKNNQRTLGGYFSVGQGIFSLSSSEKNNMTLTPAEKELLKPEFKTADLTKYYANPHNKYWVIYTDSSFKNLKKMINYPNLKKHIDKFSKVITSNNKPYGLHAARNETFFLGEKIISTRKCKTPTFTYVDFNSYVSSTFFVIKTRRTNLKYLTALLNSKLIEFWLRSKGKMQGNMFQVDKEPLLDIPIYNPSIAEQQPLINLVDKIIAAKQQNKDTTTLESEIDELVYSLYDLTAKEISIIEQ